ncbi:MAG TPA: hypothetical protein VGD67_05990 [Pseudonocardiaceae bacterium]
MTGIGILMLAALVAAGTVTAVLLRRRRRPGPTAVDGPAIAVPTFRVVALGLSGSGKTLLLTSMYRRLSTPGDRGFFVRAPYQQLIELNRWYAQIADPGTEWPRGTSRGEMREFEFDVLAPAGERATPVVRLGYLEYPGELLTDQDAPGSTAQARLLEAIAGADALIGIVDGLRVRQALLGEARGRVALQTALDAMVHSMLTANCPIAFVVTKWDLLDDLEADENTRLGLVRELLMTVDGFRDLVRLQGARRILRLVPVTAVGHDFAVLDAGEVRKRPHGMLRPSNVDVPLSAVVPDALQQLEFALDHATREAVVAEARRRLRMRPLEAVQTLGEFVAQHAGKLLVNALGGGLVTSSVLGLYADAQVAAGPDPRHAVLTEADRRADELIRARRHVLNGLRHRVSVLEATLPNSRLGPW